MTEPRVKGTRARAAPRVVSATFTRQRAEFTTVARHEQRTLNLDVLINNVCLLSDIAPFRFIVRHFFPWDAPGPLCSLTAFLHTPPR